MDANKEQGYALCRNRRTGRIHRGPRAEGTHNRINIPLTCKAGTQLIGAAHSHPGGLLEPSPIDYQEAAKDKRLKVICIWNETIKAPGKCYRIEGR